MLKRQHFIAAINSEALSVPIQQRIREEEEKKRRTTEALVRLKMIRGKRVEQKKDGIKSKVARIQVKEVKLTFRPGKFS